MCVKKGFDVRRNATRRAPFSGSRQYGLGVQAINIIMGEHRTLTAVLRVEGRPSTIGPRSGNRSL
jgi:hypothetical protein